jgi:hypothetical protein
MANLCSLEEEGRLAPKDMVRKAATRVSPSAAHTKKGGLRKRGTPHLTVEPSALARVAQKSQGAKEVAVVKTARKKCCPYMSPTTTTHTTAAPSSTTLWDGRSVVLSK